MRRDSRARILVVEDEPELAAEVDQTLVELGYDVVGRAARSDEAIERTEERKPDLLLMDIRLRGKRDGIETAAEIRDRFRLPVVFMSAHTDEATLGRARRSSPYGYVVKPFTLGELWTAIEIALERHALETKLREGERWFQTTLRSIGDAILCTDVEGAVTFMNQRAEKLLGWRFDDVANRPAADVFQVIEERSRSVVTLPLGEVLRGEPKPAVPDGLLLLDRSGGGIPIDASVAPICDEDKVLGAVVVFRDLSDRRVLQRRLEFADRLAALGTMAAGIAHEVNNPLAVIMANLAMLAEAQSRSTPQPALAAAGAATATAAVAPPRSWLDNATVREILADAVTAADRVRRIVADLRSFTQADDVGEGPVDVERALKWALQSTAREFRHRARVVTQFGQLPLLGGSEVRLGQVFVNLLVNAAHSISPGQVNTNEVRVNARADERGWVVVEISDTGSGIPHEIRGKIFDPFFTTKPTGMGSGLGLSVCLGIVKSFGGEILVESELGRGSVFRVRLPPGAAAFAPSDTPAPTTEGALRPRILVIDDEPLVRRAIERSLELEHDIVSAASAAEALAILERDEPFDLILCDLMMPDMTGMDVAARLARDRPDVAARMVFLSGGAFTPEAAAFLAAAGRRHVEKPFRPHDLQQRVRSLLAEQNAARGGKPDQDGNQTGNGKPGKPALV
jgi:PAS domain S-box-containing protein